MRQPLNRNKVALALALGAGLISPALIGPVLAQSPSLEGREAFGDWRADKPGLTRHLTAADLPKPGATSSVANAPRSVPRPASAIPQVPAGFKVELFADGLSGPRIMRVAPNGDIFIAETHA